MAKLPEFRASDLPQSDIVVIPIIDVSFSMRGKPIAQVNRAMRQAVEQLKKLNEDLLDVRLRIAPMEFSTGARWMHLPEGVPAAPQHFAWQDLKTAGQTDFGAALELLREKLTVREKGGWMQGRGGLAPVLILITDGGPTDAYKNKLKELNKRGWFHAALKFGIAVEGAKMATLEEFTGNRELVWSVDKLNDDIEKIVRAVVVTASKTASRSASTASPIKNVTVVTASTPQADDTVKKEAEAAVVTAVDASLNDADDWFF